jgi:hypothetical protein
MADDVRAFFVRYARAIGELDFATLETMIHPEFVNDYPQSGERFHGFAGLRAQLERYPGGLASGELGLPEAKVVGAEQRWAISPGYTVLPLAGPERYTTIARAKYPDGSLWWVVSIVQLRDEKIFYSETYFAPDFEQPEWRRGISEVLPRPDHPMAPGARQ